MWSTRNVLWTSKFMKYPWFSPQEPEACSWFHEVRLLLHTNTARRVDLIRLQGTPILLRIFANEMRNCSSLKLGRRWWIGKSWLLGKRWWLSYKDGNQLFGHRVQYVKRRCVIQIVIPIWWTQQHDDASTRGPQSQTGSWVLHLYCFADARTLFFSPGAATLLAIFNRNHNLRACF